MALAINKHRLAAILQCPLNPKQHPLSGIKRLRPTAAGIDLLILVYF
jgi:hypothetical protein